MIASINMVVLETKSQKNEEHICKEKDSPKKKTTTNWTKEKKMKKIFVETIQQL